MSKIVKDAKDLPNLERIIWGGVGEPLIHPSFREIIKNTKMLKCRVSATTNGFLLSEDVCQDLVDLCVYEIVISIDAYVRKPLQK